MVGCSDEPVPGDIRGGLAGVEEPKPMSKSITVTIASAGHQYGATLTITSGLSGTATLYRDGARVASAGWDEEGFTASAELAGLSSPHGDTDDSADALDALRRALFAKLERDETYMTARRAAFA
jgi:hypothetical protein